MKHSLEQENAANVVRRILEAGIGRWAAVVGLPLLALAAAFLSAGWQLGPGRALQHRELQAMTELVEAEITSPFWWLSTDSRIDSAETHWSSTAKMSLCLTASYKVAGSAYQKIFCTPGVKARPGIPYGVLDRGQLLPDLNVPWAVDALGNPVLELRLPTTLHKLLSEQPAHHWNLVGQTESARAKMSDPGTELEYLLLEFDQPVEWIVRLWPQSSSAVISLNYHPQQPLSSFPSSVIGSLEVGIQNVVTASILLIVGVALWKISTALLFPEYSATVKLLLFLPPLLALPWWSDGIHSLARWFDSETHLFGLDMYSELLSGSDLPIISHPAEAVSELTRLPWPIIGGSSYYSAILNSVGIRRPQPAPVDSDEALLSAVSQVDAFITGLSDEECALYFDALAELEIADRGNIGLLFLSGARKTVDNLERSTQAKDSATRFVTWFATSPIEPTSDQPAHRSRIDLWKLLVDFPNAPGAKSTAKQIVDSSYPLR